MKSWMLAAAAASTLLLAAPAAARAETVWLCLPGMADNPCEIGMDTTVRDPAGGEQLEEPAVPSAPPVDCFYVYPTVSNQLSDNATKERDPELVSIAKYQAARFSLGCRVFAPIYRQGTLYSLATASGEREERIREIAFADVQEAWREYLARHNGGRGVVLIGHSQGTRMLRQLIRTDIDGDATVRSRLVSALLIGGQVTVPRGSTAGGDFQNVPLCERPGQLGCVVAYSTYSLDPPPNSRYGRPDPDGYPPFGFPTGPEYEIACTDPRPLARWREPLRVLTPTEPFAPGPIAAGILVTGGPQVPASTTWVVARDRWTGGCERIDDAHVLRYEPTPGSMRPNPFPDPTWGTHIVDVNLTLDPLVEIVRLQARRYARR